MSFNSVASRFNNNIIFTVLKEYCFKNIVDLYLISNKPVSNEEAFKEYLSPSTLFAQRMLAVILANYNLFTAALNCSIDDFSNHYLRFSTIRSSFCAEPSCLFIFTSSKFFNLNSSHNFELLFIGLRILSVIRSVQLMLLQSVWLIFHASISYSSTENTQQRTISFLKVRLKLLYSAGFSF